MFFKTIFTKAQTEHAYANFYAKLCFQIVRLELQMKGLAPTRANGMQSDFRKNLLNNCKISFEQLLNAKETVEKKNGEKQEDRLDREFLQKHKCFGNIEFVGELYKEGLISDIILSSIFESMLGIDQKADHINNITVEAALILINKLGSTMEFKLKSLEDDAKYNSYVTFLNSVFEKFEEL